MGLFGGEKKRDDAAKKAVKQPLPIDKILDMRKRGLSNNQIVEALQKDGYTITQIFDALNQCDLREATDAGMKPMEGAPDKPLDLGPSQIEPAPDFYSGGAQPPQQLDYPQGYQQPYMGMTEEELVEKIEEVTETIIEEKWKDFVETVEKIIDWKNAFTEKVDGIAKDLEHLKQEFDKLHTAILRKVEQYDKSMGNVGAQLKAMEMVFKDVLPQFTDNVKMLSQVTEGISKKRRKKK
ncbi:hypothetical protein DRJ48_02815 [Candidatus Woesearchaeota archaeon]|nr:MAG: hypothetical protein DRJ48_02815 [Candidatus Woesearchaeota archaeon]